MLIINADDWGGWRTATDAALACWQQGRITSVSAMVFMEDSERAARLAKDCGMEVGLHINFSQPLTGDVAANRRIMESHWAIMRFLRSSRYALVLYHPFLRRQFREVFEAQLGEFRRLYGREPSHFDGHQHFHLCTNVLLDEILPAGQRVRRSFSFAPGEKSGVNRAYRRWVDRCLAARHPLTDDFYSLTQQLRWGQLDRIFHRAGTATVELMVHPEWPVEREFLTGDRCTEALETLHAKT